MHMGILVSFPNLHQVLRAKEFRNKNRLLLVYQQIGLSRIQTTGAWSFSYFQCQMFTDSLKMLFNPAGIKVSSDRSLVYKINNKASIEKQINYKEIKKM